MQKWLFHFLKGSILLASVNLSLAAEEVPPQLAKPHAIPKSLPKPAIINKPKKNLSIAELLNWLPDSNPNNLCKGCFIEIPLQLPANLAKENIVVINADRASFIENSSIIYTDNVRVMQANQKIHADKAITVMEKNQRSIKTIKAYGNVNIQQPDIIAVAQRAKINVTEKTAVFYASVYRLLSKKNTSQLAILTPHGIAKIAKQTAPQQYDLVNATYTTCSPINESWKLHAKNVHIDQAKKRVIAKNVYFTIVGAPVAYTPYINFSYDKTPKSGLLAPIIGYATRSGLQLGLPFYWYSAPNATAIITPTIFSQRGSRFETDFHYLTWRSLGRFYFSFLPYDKTFAGFKRTAGTAFPNNASLARLQHANTTRSYFSWKNKILLNPYWKSLTKFNYVSDDYYFKDFGGSSNQGVLNQLVQQTALEYNGKNWTFSGSLQNYQTLHPIDISNTSPFIDRYASWPKLALSVDYPDNWGGLQYKGQFNYVNFRQPIFTNYFPSNITEVVGSPIIGQRIHIQPGISLPFYQSWGYFKPQIQLNKRLYKLSNLSAKYPQQNLNYTIPIFNIDSGLYFDRSVQINKQDYTQTLEPRFFYLRVPAVNQQNIPIFDTSEPAFTYDSIFQTNRFIGVDRISNANQVGIGLSTHFINKATGSVRFTANIGELFYFENRKVSIVTSPSDNKMLSPIVANFTYYITNAVTFSGNSAWNPNYCSFQNGALAMRYKPDENRLVNVGLNYKIPNNIAFNTMPYNKNDELKQISISGSWPISSKLSTLGALNYNINNKYAQTYLLGLEYNTCCWALRAVTARNYLFLNTQNRPTYDTSYHIQFVLKGLTSLGSNDGSGLLANNIPGYTNKL